MFDIGIDQADGLKRLFGPPSGLQLNMVSDAGCRDARTLAYGLVAQLRDAGVEAALEEATRVGREPPAPRVLISPLALGAQPRPAAGRRQGAVILAHAIPDRLPTLYGAIKQLDGVLSPDPLMVVWEDTFGSRRDEAVRALCERNLSRTVERFLGRALVFNELGGAAGAVDAGLSLSTLQWMASTVVRRLDGLLPREPRWAN
jgi:hypothetical protein